MNQSKFRLAATTDDLSREQRARDVADSIEFRMDKADDPIAQLEAYDGDLPVIATNRAEWAGGETDDDGRLEQLQTAAGYEFVETIDLEVEVARESKTVLEEFHSLEAELIVSYHEFDATPDRDSLAAIVNECGSYGDIAKVATFANDLTDTLRMLETIHGASKNGGRVAGISMGELGRHTRVIGPLYGSVLGYAPLESDTSKYAPGQIPLDSLRTLYTDLVEPRSQ